MNVSSLNSRLETAQQILSNMKFHFQFMTMFYVFTSHPKINYNQNCECILSYYLVELFGKASCETKSYTNDIIIIISFAFSFQFACHHTRSLTHTHRDTLTHSRWNRCQESSLDSFHRLYNQVYHIALD